MVKNMFGASMSVVGAPHGREKQGNETSVMHHAREEKFRWRSRPLFLEKDKENHSQQ